MFALLVKQIHTSTQNMNFSIHLDKTWNVNTYISIMLRYLISKSDPCSVFQNTTILSDSYETSIWLISSHSREYSETNTMNHVVRRQLLFSWLFSSPFPPVFRYSALPLPRQHQIQSWSILTWLLNYNSLKPALIGFY